ncbi:hypothetical protein IEQ34_026016 [Dendrobium chrysotoxum]|uniref:Uncharacterized protein n=1 Tax=Dendrobium chrysotoxum TaxID=161865 RepID=A0AAV7FNM5_DENCH|nr:hypothetical protein IEQ34_026016 [Dendrobium chrysotoxum]
MAKNIVSFLAIFELPGHSRFRQPCLPSEVKFLIYERRTTAKAFAKDVFINQERKLGARRRSDTVLVSTINDADQGSADVAFRTPPAPCEKSKFLGSLK